MIKKKVFPILALSLSLLSGCNEMNSGSGSLTATSNSNPNSNDALYSLTIPHYKGCSITAPKSEYKAGELVNLDVKLEDKYFIETNSLKYNNVVIDDSLSFTMPSENVVISASIVKDDVPDNQIHGARIVGESEAIWNMALVDVNNVSLENVSSVVVEVRFNKMIDNFWFRLGCATESGDVYDAFGKDSSSNYRYTIDMDQPNADDHCFWETSPWGGWVPTWNSEFDKVPPTFFVEVPLNALFARFSLAGTLVAEQGSTLKQDQKLAKLGIHITGPASETDFTIGRLFVRKNNALKLIASPENYSLKKEEGKNRVSVFKIDPFGTYTSNLNIEIYSKFKGHKKNMLMMGDSIMTRWWSNNQIDRVANAMDANLIRDTIGGTTIASTNNLISNDYSLMYQKDKGLFDRYFEEMNMDYIIIQRGTNDLWQVKNGGYKLGDENSTDNRTVLGALRELLMYFKEKCPNAKIVLSTLLYRHDDISDALVQQYNTAIKALADDLGDINLFDLYNLSGINENNYEEYLNSSSKPHHNNSPADYLHPNDDGAELIGDAWIKYLNNI